MPRAQRALVAAIHTRFIEAFNGRLRDECLNVELFSSLDGARRTLAVWRAAYNRVCPHSALRERTPVDVAAAWAPDSRTSIEALT